MIHAIIHEDINLIAFVIPGLTRNPVFSCPPEADRFRGKDDFCWNEWRYVQFIGDPIYLAIDPFCHPKGSGVSKRSQIFPLTSGLPMWDTKVYNWSYQHAALPLGKPKAFAFPGV